MGIRSYLRAATDARQEIAKNARLEGELKRLQFANIQLATKLLIAGEQEGEKEREFAEAFLDYNNLDEEMAQEYAKEAEIEGKILLKLDWDEEAKMVAVEHVSWTAKEYKEKAHRKDYTKYRSGAWN